MLAKAFNLARSQITQNSGLVAFTKRGVYAAGQEPKVFVNQHTRVICQGITGKHVSRVFSNSYPGHFPHSAGHRLRHKDGRRC